MKWSAQSVKQPYDLVTLMHQYFALCTSKDDTKLEINAVVLLQAVLV